MRSGPMKNSNTRAMNASSMTVVARYDDRGSTTAVSSVREAATRRSASCRIGSLIVCRADDRVDAHRRKASGVVQSPILCLQQLDYDLCVATGEILRRVAGRTKMKQSDGPLLVRIDVLRADSPK